MCCDSWEDGPAIDVCPDCGDPVNEDGLAVTGCHYSPMSCESCGSHPCDDSC